MFTGLIEEVGTVVTLRPNESTTRLEVAAPRVAGRVRLGDSVAVDGCCLTAITNENARLGFDLLQETLGRTNLNAVRPGSRVNLELAVTAAAPLGGHFVQGHVDCAAAILALDQRGADLRLGIDLPSRFAPYVVGKGSVAVNGISLTIVEVLSTSFAVLIIPHTLAQTNLSNVKPGDLVNLEFDILAKYVERALNRRSGDPV
jgi:riboflavin synthase